MQWRCVNGRVTCLSPSNIFLRVSCIVRIRIRILFILILLIVVLVVARVVAVLLFMQALIGHRHLCLELRRQVLRLLLQ